MANQPEYMLSILHVVDRVLSAKNDTVAIITCERPDAIIGQLEHLQ